MIDSIILASDKKSCVVNIADGPSLKYDFEAMGVEFEHGLNLIRIFHSEILDLAA